MKRIVSIILSLTIILGLLHIPVCTSAKESYEKGIVKVVVDEDKVKSCNGILKDDIVFVDAEQLAKINGYSCEKGADEDYTFYEINDNSMSLRANTAFTVNVKNKKAEAMGKKFDIDAVVLDKKLYLPMERTLYLMHAQWFCQDNSVHVVPLRGNILDFILDNYDDISSFKPNQSDLYVNGQGKWSSSSLAVINHISSDFDARLLSLGVEEVMEDDVRDALLLLNNEETSLLNEEDVKELAKLDLLEKSGSMMDAEAFATSIGTMPSNVEDGVNVVIDALNSTTSENSYFKTNPLNNVLEVSSNCKYTAFVKKIETVNDVLSVIRIGMNAYQISMRSASWNASFMESVRMLTELDKNNYNSNGKRIIKVANEMVKELDVGPGDSVLKGLVFDTTSVLADALFDASPIGVAVKTIMNVSNLATIFNPEYAKKVEGYNIVYAANSSVKVQMMYEQLFNNYYSHNFSMAVNDFDEYQLQKLHYATKAFLQLGMKNWEYVYQLKTLLSDEPNWTQTKEAETIKTQYKKYYELLVELNNYESIYAAPESGNIEKMTFEDMKNNEINYYKRHFYLNVEKNDPSEWRCSVNGCVREKISKDLLLKDCKKEAYSRYKEVIKEYESKYGKATYNEGMIEGVAFIKLIDFDDDNLEELVFFCSNNDSYRLFIYGYDRSNDKAVKIVDEDYIIQYHTDNISVHISQGDDKYIYNHSEREGTEYTDELFFKIVNNKKKDLKKFSKNWGDNTYYINDEKVSSDTHNAGFSDYYDNTRTYLLLSFEDFDIDSFNETLDVTRDTRKQLGLDGTIEKAVEIVEIDVTGHWQNEDADCIANEASIDFSPDHTMEITLAVRDHYSGTYKVNGNDIEFTIKKAKYYNNAGPERYTYEDNPNISIKGTIKNNTIVIKVTDEYGTYSHTLT